METAYLRTYFLFLSFNMISDSRKTHTGAERSQDLWVDVFNSNFHSNTKFLQNKHPGIGMNWLALVDHQDPFKAIWFLTLHSKAPAIFSEKHSPHFKAASFSIFQSRLAANSKHWAIIWHLPQIEVPSWHAALSIRRCFQWSHQVLPHTTNVLFICLFQVCFSSCK